MKTKLKSKIRNICRYIITRYYYLFPVFKNKVIFDNFGGKGFGDHPRYIAEEIHRRGLNWDLVWLVSDINTPTPEWIRKVKYRSVRSLYECATSKIWVDNIRNAHLLPKRKKQIYLQTWHGSQMFAYKQIEKDAEAYLSDKYINAAKYDGEIIDGIISQCSRDSEKYRGAFWLNKDAEILEFGGPREDILFNSQYIDSNTSALKKKLHLTDKDFVVLYAPTYRDYGSAAAYNLDFKGIQKAFEEIIGKRCIIIVRLHPNVQKETLQLLFDDTLRDGSSILDTNDALMISDVVITDFSSIIYEACLLKKIPFLCALDYDYYIKNRPLIPASIDYPFLKAKSCEELIRLIKTTNWTTYWKTIEDYFSCHPSFDDGYSSVRTVNWLCKKRNE